MKVFAPALLALLPSCATIMGGGGGATAHVSSDPAGAAVFLDDKQVGVTPCQVFVDRRADGDFELRLDGYQPAAWTMEPQMNPWIIGDVLFWYAAIIPLGIDFMTGNHFWRYDEDFAVVLEPAAEQSPPPRPEG